MNHAELVAIHNPKDATKLADSYRDVARKSPKVSESETPIDPEQQAEKSTEGMIRLAHALGDDKAAKHMRQVSTAAKVLKRVKARKKGKRGQG